MNQTEPLSFREFYDDLQRAPFVRILLPLLLGIVVQVHVMPLPFSASWLVVSMLLIIVVCSLTPWWSSYTWRWLWGVFFFLGFYFMGCGLVQQKPMQSNIPQGRAIAIQALVCEQAQEREKSIRVDVLVKAYADSTKQWQAYSEKAILYLSKTSPIPQAGDLLLCQASFTPVSAPQNPLEFNYRNYLARQGVYASAFVDSSALRLLQSKQLPFYRMFPLQLQHAAISAFKQAGLDGDELAVATALTTGNKDFLDDELRQSYSSAGAIHLLAVSGLHVGIVFVIISFLLAFMDRFRHGRMLRGVLIILLLWTYAAVAGFAPSVVRASFMFTVFAIGDMANKPRNTYNNIAFSAFVLCVVNPCILFDVGFQLSYAAVLGIVYFQPKIEALLTFRHKWVQHVWSLACVTLSAQLATLPIILYVFHQFPTYFLFSNMLVVPLTPIVMYVAVAVLALAWWPMAASALGWCLTILIKLLNGTVSLVEQLPYSVMGGIYIDSTQAMMLAAALLLLACYWMFRKRLMAHAMLMLLIAVGLIRASHLWTLEQQVELGAYSVPQSSFSYLMEGRTAWNVRDSSHADKRCDFNTMNHLVSHGFKSERQMIPLKLADSVLGRMPATSAYHRGVMLFHGKRIAWLSQLSTYLQGLEPSEETKPLPLDYLFVDTRSTMRPNQVLSFTMPQNIVLSNNVPPWQAARWIEEAEKGGVTCHYTKEKGAFIVSD